MSPFSNKIVLLALSMEKMEGYNPPSLLNLWRGSRSWRNRNPGNLKRGSFTADLGAVGVDSGNFLIFPDYGTGIFALCKFLQRAADGTFSPVYDPLGNLVKFYAKYDSPVTAQRYAEFVTKYSRLDINAPIKSFLS